MVLKFEQDRGMSSKKLSLRTIESIKKHVSLYFCTSYLITVNTLQHQLQWKESSHLLTSNTMKYRNVVMMLANRIEHQTIK
jgi:hypothetical protein